MNSSIITRAQTPTSMYKYRAQASTLPVLSSSAVWWYCRLLLCRESKSKKDPNMAIHPTPPQIPPPLSGLLLYVAILSKVRRCDLSLHRSVLSLTLNPSGVWAGMIQQDVPFPPKLADPPSLRPSLLLLYSLHFSLNRSFPTLSHSINH